MVIISDNCHGLDHVHETRSLNDDNHADVDSMTAHYHRLGVEVQAPNYPENWWMEAEEGIPYQSPVLLGEAGANSEAVHLPEEDKVGHCVGFHCQTNRLLDDHRGHLGRAHNV